MPTAPTSAAEKAKRRLRRRGASGTFVKRLLRLVDLLSLAVGRARKRQPSGAAFPAGWIAI